MDCLSINKIYEKLNKDINFKFILYLYYIIFIYNARLSKKIKKKSKSIKNFDGTNWRFCKKFD